MIQIFVVAHTILLQPAPLTRGFCFWCFYGVHLATPDLENFIVRCFSRKTARRRSTRNRFINACKRAMRWSIKLVLLVLMPLILVGRGTSETLVYYYFFLTCLCLVGGSSRSKYPSFVFAIISHGTLHCFKFFLILVIVFGSVPGVALE